MELTPHDEQLYHILSSSGLKIGEVNELFKKVRLHIAVAYDPKAIDEVIKP